MVRVTARFVASKELPRIADDRLFTRNDFAKSGERLPARNIAEDKLRQLTTAIEKVKQVHCVAKIGISLAAK